MVARIFINYPREDSTGTAGRLRDRLAQSFGPENLFMDVDNIPPGIDFIKYLNNQVATCDVFIAVIGPHWLDARNEKGDRRLDDPDDPVAIEIEAALARDIRVIPALVDGAGMPKMGNLPEALKPLARRNAIELRNNQFGRDAEALIEKIREAFSGRSVRINRWRAAAGVAIALLLLGGIGLFATDIRLPWVTTKQADYEALLKQIEDELIAKKYDRAIEIASEAIRVDPARVEGFHLRANAYVWKGD